jgi:hypothetical protein
LDHTNARICKKFGKFFDRESNHDEAVQRGTVHGAYFDREVALRKAVDFETGSATL